MQIIEVIFSRPQPSNGASCRGINTEYFSNHEEFQQWRENYPEYIILEVTEEDLDETI